MKFKKTIDLMVFALIFNMIGEAALTKDVCAADVPAPRADGSTTSDGNVSVITHEKKMDLIAKFREKYGPIIEKNSKIEDGQLFLSCYYSKPDTIREMFVDLSKLIWLTELTIRHADYVSLHPFHDLQNLRTLYLDCCRNLQDLDEVQNLRSLEELYLSCCKGFKSLDWLQRGMLRLKCLSLSECEVTSLSGLGQCPELEVLSLSFCRSLNGLEGLQVDLPKLTDLYLYESGVTSFRGLEHCKELVELDFGSCKGLKSLDWLQGCSPKLKKLCLSSSGVASLEGLKRHQKLVELDLEDCTWREESEIEGLINLPNLKTIHAFGSLNGLDEQSKAGLQQRFSGRGITLSFQHNLI